MNNDTPHAPFKTLIEALFSKECPTKEKFRREYNARIEAQAEALDGVHHE